jgi:hypothetical protein
MSNSTEETIRKLLVDIIKNTLKRTKQNLIKDKKPFHKALLDEEVIKLSSFERSFSTSFGQKYVEAISKLIVEETAGMVERGRKTQVSVYQGASDQIDLILGDLKSNKTKPDWNRELSEIKAHNKGRTILRGVISDLWFERNDKQHFFSIKTVQPNLDQTSIAKRDMLLLKAHDPEFEVFFGLYYNPTGEQQNEYSISLPNKYFNMKSDKCVLIGIDYWDFLGGTGTYSRLLELFNEIGKQTINQVRNLKL